MVTLAQTGCRLDGGASQRLRTFRWQQQVLRALPVFRADIFFGKKHRINPVVNAFDL